MERRDFFKKAGMRSAALVSFPTFAHALAKPDRSDADNEVTELRIDIENYVPYNYDFFDPARFASLDVRTPAPPGYPLVRF